MSDMSDSIVYGFMVFNATFNNISENIMAVSFIGGGNQSTQRKPPYNAVHLALSGI
jgi:hypothetical protein